MVPVELDLVIPESGTVEAPVERIAGGRLEVMATDPQGAAIQAHHILLYAMGRQLRSEDTIAPAPHTLTDQSPRAQAAFIVRSSPNLAPGTHDLSMTSEGFKPHDEQIAITGVGADRSPLMEVWTDVNGRAILIARAPEIGIVVGAKGYRAVTRAAGTGPVRITLAAGAMAKTIEELKAT